MSNDDPAIIVQSFPCPNSRKHRSPTLAINSAFDPALINWSATSLILMPAYSKTHTSTISFFPANSSRAHLQPQINLEVKVGPPTALRAVWLFAQCFLFFPAMKRFCHDYSIRLYLMRFAINRAFTGWNFSFIRQYPICPLRLRYRIYSVRLTILITIL